MPYLSASRATKSEEIFETLSVIANSKELNELDVKKLEREADKLLKVDAVSAYTALGALASLRGDIEEAHSQHKRALKLSSRSAQALHNYAVSLAKLGEFAAAREAVSEACMRAPDDLKMLDAMVTASIFTGHFGEAHELSQRWNRSYPDRPYTPDSGVEIISRAVKQGVFTEERLQEVLAIMHDGLRTSSARALTAEVHADEREPDSFLYECFVLASPQEAEDLNNELDSAIIARPHLMDDPGLKFMPVVIGASIDVGQTE